MQRGNCGAIVMYQVTAAFDIEESSRSRTYGPSTMLAKSIPIIRGSFIFSQIAASDRPIRKIRDRDVNIILFCHPLPCI